MKSPFPGMNPYLENPELRPSVHSRLIVAIADELVDHLSNIYRVEIEKRTYFSSDDESLLVGLPDVAVATSHSAELLQTNTATLSPVQPQKVTLPVSGEVNERYLEIREATTGRVVTVIELLSPKNKRSGEGRIAYSRKRNQILSSLTHLIEIDLLRSGQPFPIDSPNLGDYRILISRSEHRPTADLYAFTLAQPIPPIPIPLLPGDTEPILDLQPILNYVYIKGRYQLAIDYDQPPIPPIAQPKSGG
ncbi:MAG: DUF4058 family protein [Elainellaceae cyanobacterium]